jgi:hypothetical protein
LQLICILPGLISLYFVLLGRADKAFLNVYLPCLLLLPQYYYYRIPHLTALSTSDFALIPIAIYCVMHLRGARQIRRMDFWVLLFITSFAVSEITREHFPKDGISLWLALCVVEMLMSYVVGRVLIEPSLRLETIKRSVIMLLCHFPFGVYEFVRGKNLWINIGYRMFQFAGGWEHDRGGYTRIGTCLGGPIHAGMTFMFAMAFSFYLAYLYKTDRASLGTWTAIIEKYRLPFLLFPMLIVMTVSRMPMACTVLVVLLMQIPRFKKIRTGVIVIGLIVVVGTSAVYYRFEKYTSVAPSAAKDEAQGSAIYRKQMLENYAPVVEAGGWFGWGSLSFPNVGGQSSIDNAYLLAELGQGKIGLYLFLIIAAESLVSLSIYAVIFKVRQNRVLVFCFLASLVSLFVCLYTVYLGALMPQLLFLLLGWSQSLQDVPASGAQPATVQVGAEPKFHFRRVIA